MTINAPLPLASLINETPILGPIGVGFDIIGSSSWTQVLASDVGRRGVYFFNPGTNNLLVTTFPFSTPPQLGGSYLIYPGGDFELYAPNEIANMNNAWYAAVDSGSGQPISILNYTGTNNSVSAPQPLANLNFGVPIASPLTTAINILGTSSFAVIGANPVRRAIVFHNPGTVRVAVTPANLTATFNGGGIIILPGETKTIRAQGLIRVNCGWNAIAESGSNQPFTVAELL